MRLDVLAVRLRDGRTDEDREAAASIERAARAAAAKHSKRGQDFARMAFYGALWGAVFRVSETLEKEL